jgi:hypothetical protein
MRALLHMLVAALLLAGCSETRFTPSAGGQAPAPHQGPVALLEQLPPEGSYRLLGVVKVTGVRLTSDARMYDDLRERAAASGANAVVPQGPIRDRPTRDGGTQRALAGWAIQR